VISTVYEEAYTLTDTGLDLLLRGMIRALSFEPKACHSCMKAYKQVFFAVLSLEQIYQNWQDVGRGLEGSYLIFKNLTNFYERLQFVDLHCKVFEMAYTMRNKLAAGQLFQIKDYLAIVELPQMLLLLWYGIWWD